MYVCCSSDDWFSRNRSLYNTSDCVGGEGYFRFIALYDTLLKLLATEINGCGRVDSAKCDACG